MKNPTLAVFLLAAVGLCGCGEVVPPGGGDDGSAVTATAVTPDHGPVVGGIEVTITGTGFASGDAGDPSVVVGGYAAPDATAVSDTSVTFTLPPGVEEGDVVDVTVYNQNGFATLARSFRFNEQPLVLDVAPNLARQAGGTSVTITGRGFENLEAGAATVLVAGVEATDVVVVDDVTITATVSAAPTAQPFAPVDVVVQNANGSDTLEGGLRLSKPGLLATDRCCENMLRYIDPATGYTAELGRLNRRVHGLALSPNGTLFAVSQRDNNFFHDLVTVDPDTLEVTTVAQIRDGAAARGAAELTFVGPTLYAVSGRPDERFFSINTTTGAITLITGLLTVQHPVGLAQRDATTAWFMDDLRSGRVDIVTVANGVITAGPPTNGVALGIQNNGTVGLEVVDGTLYATERFGARRVFSVDTTSGALTERARLPQANKGLCATPPTF